MINLVDPIPKFPCVAFMHEVEKKLAKTFANCKLDLTQRKALIALHPCSDIMYAKAWFLNPELEGSSPTQVIVALFFFCLLHLP